MNQLHVSQLQMSQLVSSNVDSDTSSEIDKSLDMLDNESCQSDTFNSPMELPLRLLEYDDPFEPTPFYEGPLTMGFSGSSDKMGEYLTKKVDPLDTDANGDDEEADYRPYRGTKSAPNIRAARMA